MCLIYETAYPQLKSKLNQNDLDLLFTPTQKELKLTNTASRFSIHKLGFLIHLKVAQKLLRFKKIATISPKLIAHIAQSMGLKHYDRKKLLAYDQGSARGNHCFRIRQHLKLSPFEAEAKELAVIAAEDAAQVRSRLPDIINVMLEELVREKYELPAFSTLKRIAQSALSRINNQYYENVCDLITDEQKEQLDALFIKKPGEQYTLWHQFKQDPKKPTPKKIKRFLRHHLDLRQLYDKLPGLQGLLPYTKYRDYKEEAQVLDASDMASLNPLKRYTLAIVFIRTKYSKMLDDIAVMIIKTLQKMDNQGQQKLEEYHQLHKKRTDKLIGKFYDVLMAVSQEDTDSECMEAIREVLPENIDKLIDDCIDHMNYPPMSTYLSPEKFSIRRQKW
ncbi:MAG: DUF4158 domain-containing protein [gamma proteobacterium symbiont of Bathyaustriella thionipta]|nr:DUF4158 domain-containing protein [gamma proteobacterium symbiont of Bathyaustriella thionipta]MCU7968677.1 DUF4158 domain-containing protein [gamma proteobacterium symbiont of Bathyaustriella thionipta]